MESYKTEQNYEDNLLSQGNDHHEENESRRQLNGRMECFFDRNAEGGDEQPFLEEMKK